MVPMNCLGALCVTDLKTGIAFNIGTGIQAWLSHAVARDIGAAARDCRAPGVRTRVGAKGVSGEIAFRK
jgi:hypothetical protein